jgi:hypothetical protein
MLLPYADVTGNSPPPAWTLWNTDISVRLFLHTLMWAIYTNYAWTTRTTAPKFVTVNIGRRNGSSEVSDHRSELGGDLDKAHP